MSQKYIEVSENDLSIKVDHHEEIGWGASCFIYLPRPEFSQLIL
jgi:hypothetical protein